MGNNHVQVSKGLRILLKAFAPYIARELGNEYGQVWWEKGVLGILWDEQKRDLPETGTWAELVDSIDIMVALRLFDLHWQGIFRKKLSIDHRTWAKELMGVRNRVAHLGGEDFSDDDTWRALDTMSRLVEQMDGESAEEIRGILRKVLYGSEKGSQAPSMEAIAVNGGTKKKDGILEKTPVAHLPSWRDVMQPHPDVAQGRYRNAEFAADLAQVSRGEGAFEYRDPVEFFGRTYVTEGMSGLLEQSLRRILKRDGEPVIQLKTSFGGGKTHSMLALYHMVRGHVSVDKIPNIKPVLNNIGISSLPKANVAVLVGTALDPTSSKRPRNLPGITINTIWGEMAAQLAVSTGRLGLYDYVKEADKKGVSPGSEVLKNLFDDAGSCLILMDEIVAYAKKIYGAKGLPAGTFDNFISFIHELTEAARASENSLVVASIPESEIEIGGEAGQIALETIEHTFGRMEAIWKPVTAKEGFEVVRRRLFLDCKKPEQRDAVCSAFSKMYRENQEDFPLEAREVEYRERMISCYPIHPEIFDRLYEDWATLERFQRTRGVLRLMAAVIHELWMGNDGSLMIMAGSLPLDIPSVRNELTRHLPENWNAIVDSEVDGKNSIPYQKDKSNVRYGGILAARRVARTIMLGSAPSVRDQSIRGIEASRIRLGLVQPGEIIANFNDALTSLTNSLTYLYTNPSRDRFWYDTRPTLRKTVQDRASQIHSSEVELEIENRLRKLRNERPFAGVHIVPNSSLDIPDEQSVRLVVLGPADTYKPGKANSTALTAVNDFLNNRGTSPRIYRNMLAFVAPDQDLMGSLQEAVQLYLAWKSIQDDSEDLNLDASQNRETRNNLERSTDTVEARIKEVYCWLMIPYIDKAVDLKTIEWEIINIQGGTDSIVTKVASKMAQNEMIITNWAPIMLSMELNNLLWRDSDHIEIKTLWDYLCTYCYLPRLANRDVLFATIRLGVNSPEYFAYASGFQSDRYHDLKAEQEIAFVEDYGYLIKLDVAKRQLAEEANERAGDYITVPGSEDGDGFHRPRTSEIAAVTDEGVAEASAEELPTNTRFYMSAELDPTRIVRDVQKLAEEIINHLNSADGCVVEISLEVNAKAPEGLSHTVVRTVSENSRTLKVKDFGFDD